MKRIMINSFWFFGMVICFATIGYRDASANDSSGKCVKVCQKKTKKERIWLCPKQHPRIATCASIEQAWRQCRQSGFGLCDLLKLKHTICMQTISTKPSESWCRWKWRTRRLMVCHNRCWRWEDRCFKQRYWRRKCVGSIAKWHRKCKMIRTPQRCQYKSGSVCYTSGKSQQVCQVSDQKQLILQKISVNQSRCNKEASLERKCTTTYALKKSCIQLGSGRLVCTESRKPTETCEMQLSKEDVCGDQKTEVSKWLPKKHSQLARCVAQFGADFICKHSDEQQCQPGTLKRVCERTNPVFRTRCKKVPATKTVCKRYKHHYTF